MSLTKLESAIKEQANNRQRKGQLAMIPMDLFDALEETLPHGLVVQLGELILKLKGVGHNNL